MCLPCELAVVSDLTGPLIHSACCFSEKHPKKAWPLSVVVLLCASKGNHPKATKPILTVVPSDEGQLQGGGGPVFQ